MIRERIDALRERMIEKNIDVYYIPTADFHQSEYVGDYFTARKYMSGFTGSAGMLIVTKEKAGLWTDGRYFIQAENQLKDSGIELYKMGLEGVPTISEFILNEIPENGTVGFDGRVVDAKFGKMLEDKLKKKQAKIIYEEDLVDKIWSDRPAISAKPAFLLDVKYAGKSREDKLEELRKDMQSFGATTFICTTLDDIAWLFNLRGDDILYNPVVLSFACVTMKNAYLFVNEACISDEIREAFKTANIEIRAYEEIYTYVSNIKEDEVVLLDSNKVNYKITRLINDKVRIIV